MLSNLTEQILTEFRLLAKLRPLEQLVWAKEAWC